MKNAGDVMTNWVELDADPRRAGRAFNRRASPGITEARCTGT